MEKKRIIGIFVIVAVIAIGVYFIFMLLPMVTALASNTFYLVILLVLVAVVFYLLGKLVKYLFR